MKKSPSDGYRVTGFFLQCEMPIAFSGYRVTGFFPKLKISQPVFRGRGYRISPSRLPHQIWLNPLILYGKCHAVTGLPVLHTSLLYITREKCHPKFFLARKGLYFSKFGNPVTSSSNYASALGNLGYRSAVTSGNRGNRGKTPLNHPVRAGERPWQ